MNASNYVMYRAKYTLNEEMLSEHSTTITLLPSLLSKFQRLTPGTFTKLQRARRGRFYRVIAVLNQNWISSIQGTYGVDVAHVEDRKYNGFQMVSTGRDGNICNKIAAIALVPV